MGAPIASTLKRIFSPTIIIGIIIFTLPLTQFVSTFSKNNDSGKIISSWGQNSLYVGNTDSVPHESNQTSCMCMGSYNQSAYTSDQLTYSLGCLPEPIKPEVRVSTSIVVELPSSFDWRDVNGTNWMTPVKHQGWCGSCVSFAAVGMLEARIKYLSGISTLEPDFSEQHLLSCGGGSCSGWYISSALNYLQDYGVPEEECYPYADFF